MDNKVETKEGVIDYTPETINMYVKWNPKFLKERSSLSVNYTRNAVSLDFTRKNEDNSIIKISRKISIEHLRLLSSVISKEIIGQRINLAALAKEKSGEVLYPKIDPSMFAYTNVFFDKKINDFSESGLVSFSTINIHGLERVAISGHDTKGNTITVALYDESATRSFAKVAHGIVDSQDIPLYHLGLMLEECCKAGTILIYGMGDKILQALYRQFPGLRIEKPTEKKTGWVNNFKKKLPWGNNTQQFQRTAEVKSENPSEEGGDIFDTF